LPERSYTRSLGERARKRHYHKTERGKVIEFIVQLEIEVKGEWRPAIRYNSAHGFPHIDHYNMRGDAKKEKLKLSFAEALSLADVDINQNWEFHKEKFLRGGYP